MILRQSETDLFDSLPAAPVSRTFMQYLIAFSNRLEAASDVISDKCGRPIVPHKCVKFPYPRLNRPWEIPPEAIEGGIFGRFLKTSMNAERK